MSLIFKKYHSINQFKDVVRAISHTADFKGLDDNGDVIYETSEKPVLSFVGTVKLHGTNAGIVYHPDHGIQGLKRSSLLAKDALAGHFGFNQWVQAEQREALLTEMHELWLDTCTPDEQLTLYGEWAGDGIQRGVAISERKKAFYAFDMKATGLDHGESRWLSIQGFNLEVGGMYNIHKFPTYTLTIDFNKPELAQNALIKITEAVEKQCPISKCLGVDGIGEGVVWTAIWRGEKYIFKVKGEKHSSSKVKKLAPVNEIKAASIREFVEYAVTQNRVEQGMFETQAIEKRQTPAILRWVANDIIKEETDTLVANGLEWKQVAKACANRTRQIFFSIINNV